MQSKPPVKSNKAEPTLMEQISKGVTLTKCETVEKTGIDLIKKRESVSKIPEIETTKAEVKGDLFAEMRKVQLKKLNK